MSYVPPGKPVWDQPAERSGGSPVKWIVLGCGVIFLLVVLICGGVTLWGVRVGMQTLDQMTEEYVAQGYAKQMGQVIQVGQSPETKTVYVCQVLRVTAEVDTDIAAVCQMMEVNANINGDLDFAGQVLVVKSGVVIDGDLRIKNAQSVDIQGEVKGSITGNYMVLKYRGRSYTGGQVPQAEEAAEGPVGEAPEPPASKSLPAESTNAPAAAAPPDAP